jgi:hypothetical protein
MRQGHPLHNVEHVVHLGAWRLKELQADRGVEEQTPHPNLSTSGVRGVLNGSPNPTVQHQASAYGVTLDPCDQLKPADLGNRRQRLSPKP